VPRLGVAFGAMAAFGKLAYGAGATVGTLLSALRARRRAALGAGPRQRRGALAVALFGERLAALQLAGGAAMLGGVLVLNARLPRRAVRRSTVQVLTPSIDMLDRREIAT
jgi:drug/metabolite transporter (DMT)-like permease